MAAIRARSLELVSPAGNVRAPVDATDVPAEIGPCDAVLFCVKSYDTQTAAAALPALCHGRTIVASLQNGVGSADQLAQVVGRAHVVGGWR